MGFGEAISSCLGKYVTWRGRASRSEFWYFYLFYILCVLVAAIVDHLLGTTFKMTNPVTGMPQASPYGWVYLLVVLFFLLPMLSAQVRRLHDTDHSGWWLWFVLVPIIGAIVLLVWFCSRGTRGDNRYGTDPLGLGYAATFS